jgi:hypothetical protein
MSMHSRSLSGHHFAMNHNTRSNRGGLRRGQQRAAYVHQLNSERRGTGTATGTTGTTARTGTTGTSTGARTDADDARAGTTTGTGAGTTGRTGVGAEH